VQNLTFDQLSGNKITAAQQYINQLENASVNEASNGKLDELKQHLADLQNSTPQSLQGMSFQSVSAEQEYINEVDEIDNEIYADAAAASEAAAAGDWTAYDEDIDAEEEEYTELDEAEEEYEDSFN